MSMRVRPNSSVLVVPTASPGADRPVQAVVVAVASEAPALRRADPPASEPIVGAMSALSVRSASNIALINNAALVALRDVDNGGKKGTSPPMVARAMFWVSQAVAEVYDTHEGSADSAARRTASLVVAGLLGQQSPKLDHERKADKGAAIAANILRRAADDGAAQAHEPRAVGQTAGRPLWTPVDARGAAVVALLPSFGRVQHAVPANAEVRAPAPRLSDDDWRSYFATRTAPTPDEVACAKFWADGPGTFTPPGHWNTIAVETALLAGISEPTSARLLAAVNAALHDAGISCWDTKFEYGGERPFQAADRLGIAFAPTIGTPPFPGYTSGHATFSAAAAAVLGRFFDAEGKADVLRERLVAHAKLPGTRERIRGAENALEMFTHLAQEAAHSRVVGGIHIEEDGTVGVDVGLTIGTNAWSAFFAAGENRPDTGCELAQ